MKKEFVPYEQALALKELGFDEPCIMCYYGISNADEDKKERLYLSSGMGKVCNSHLVEKENGITAPLYQQVFEWFRDSHQLYHEIQVDQTTSPKFCYSISRFIGNPDNLSETEWDWENIQSDETWGLYRKHNEAELACIDKLIQIVNYENSDNRS